MLEATWRSSTAEPAVLSVQPGSWLRVLGPTGSGKSSLCVALAGVERSQPELTAVRLFGRVIEEIPSSERAHSTAYVPSDPTLAFSGLLPTLAGELQIAARMTADPSRAALLLPDVIRFFRLDQLLARDPFTLSGGEGARAAVAVSLIKQPTLLILDQMADHLDASGHEQLRWAVDALLPPDAIVVETFARHHDIDEASQSEAVSVQQGWGRWEVWILQRGGQYRPSHSPPTCLEAIEHDPERRDKAIVEVRDLTFRYEKGDFALPRTDLTVMPGERLALTGPNGSGKTTLLKCLALLLSPSFGRFEVAAADGSIVAPPNDPRALHEWARHALYCFQRPEDQLYLPTARLEILETVRRVGKPGAEQQVDAIAEDLGLTPFLDRSPFDVSRGHRRMIPIAGAVASGVPLVLLDEPSAGLDDDQVKRLARVLATRCRDRAIIMISHDRPFVKEAATSEMRLSPSVLDPREKRQGRS